jgi:hypothetical protein
MGLSHIQTVFSFLRLTYQIKYGHRIILMMQLKRIKKLILLKNAAIQLDRQKFLTD